MNKKLIITLALLLFSTSAFAEIIYPFSSKEDLQALVFKLNQQKIKMSDWYYDEDINPGANKTFEKVESVNNNGEFFIEGVNGGFKFFKADINNDGKDEYIKALEVGSFRLFGIEAVYKEVDGKFVDIYNEIQLPMQKAINKAKGVKENDPRQPAPAFGDMLIEKKDGKVYFTILEGAGKRGWEDLSRFDASDKPAAYEFLWAEGKLTFLRSYRRLLKKSDFYKGKNE